MRDGASSVVARLRGLIPSSGFSRSVIGSAARSSGDASSRGMHPRRGAGALARTRNMPTTWICRSVCTISPLLLTGCVEAAWGQSPPRAARDAGGDTGVAPPRARTSSSLFRRSDSVRPLLNPYRSPDDHGPYPFWTAEARIQTETDLETAMAVSTSVAPSSTGTATRSPRSDGSGHLSGPHDSQSAVRPLRAGAVPYTHPTLQPNKKL